MRSRSLFFPLVLIATGVIWLLVNLGAVPPSDLWGLYNGLPYLLALLGVSLILRARWEVAGQVASALVVGCALLMVVFAAPLGLDTPPDWDCVWGSSPLEVCTWSFDRGGAVHGSGVIVSETRPLAEFDAVSLDFPATLVIRQGETQSVRLEGDDNFLPQLGTRVSNGVLHIEVRGISLAQRVNPSQPVRVNLTVKALREVSFSAAGSVEIESLRSDALLVSASGAGSMVLHNLDVQALHVDLSGVTTVAADGTASSLDLVSSGMGSFQGENLSTQSAHVDISGMGSVTLWVIRRLTVDISGMGSLNYYGSPAIQKNVSGVGGLHSLGDK
jgi:hypothetical protein